MAHHEFSIGEAIADAFFRDLKANKMRLETKSGNVILDGELCQVGFVRRLEKLLADWRDETKAEE